MGCSNNNSYNYNNNSVCVDKFGCSSSSSPDFCIKRHDTKPSFKVIVEDCEGPMDLTDMVLEVSMWSKAKLKKNIGPSDTIIQFADNIGFEQCAVGDIIVMNRVRAPEQMLITDFNEIDYTVTVQRGYHGTAISAFKKGAGLDIFRVLNAPGSTEMDVEDVQQVDGSVLVDQITESRLVYDWAAHDTCLPGCYYLEFKLLKMLTTPITTSSTVPSQTGSYTDFRMGCGTGLGVSQVSRHPLNKTGYIIKIYDSPTSENVF